MQQNKQINTVRNNDIQIKKRCRYNLIIGILLINKFKLKKSVKRLEKTGSKLI